ncbi:MULTISPECIES: LexA family transcriptional regulator [Curvibacter]|uniref:LexA family transcriptional regulator n=1 Tax=Curvibacter TaxID=281915 RepID=UPI00036D3427|nr:MULTISPECIES: LexA family transcriptional regulator [Curvibacter]MBV5295499.1 LexA family transcriptional regulator [Curvibacter lanceolatus]
MELKDWVKAARGQLTLEQLGEKLGRSKGAIGHWETGKNKPSYDQVMAIHELTGYPLPGDLIEQQEGFEPAGTPKTTRRTPVVGTAKMGSDGYYEELQYPGGHGDGYVDGYSSDPKAYALRVKGDSMHPAIRHGSFVIVEPNGRPVPGEYVAIALKDGSKMVKELIIDRLHEVVIESVNGNHRKTLERDEIEWIYPVAAVVAASKWQPE